MVVLDPWAGSGTTGAVSSRQGVNSLCLDLNPVMATFAAGKCVDVLEVESGITKFFERLSTGSIQLEQENDFDLIANFDQLTSRQIQSAIQAIPFEAHMAEGDEIEGLVREALRDTSLIISPLYAFCLSAMFVTIRRLSGVKLAANPTWLKASGNRISLSSGEIFAEMQKTSKKMLADLREFYESANLAVPYYSMAGDVRSLPLKTSSVDRVITSPPYLTRIDYAMSTAPEMAMLGGDELLRFVRHRTMGAPVITSDEKVQKPEWGEKCNHILDAVKGHPTKAAASYYWKNIVQYFNDLSSSLKEIFRVMKGGGRGIVVVQSSYFKDIEICLGEIYVEMARLSGFKAEIAYREEVRGHLAHVNTASSKYMKNKVYYEDFVLIEKPSDISGLQQAVVDAVSLGEPLSIN